jgi:chromate reductase, NAD(P)H dehydrogenase (quinone)
MRTTPPTTRLLTISGSIRARSTNTEVLRALALVADSSIRIDLYGELATLPHFNPDLDEDGAIAPPAVGRLRTAVEAADAVIICSPEYAHGVPGVLKNALDWLVSAPSMVNKRVTLLNASPRSTHAIDSLAETLRTMSAILVPADPVTLPLGGRRLDARQIAADPELAAALRVVLERLA